MLTGAEQSWNIVLACYEVLVLTCYEMKCLCYVTEVRVVRNCHLPLECRGIPSVTNRTRTPSRLPSLRLRSPLRLRLLSPPTHLLNSPTLTRSLLSRCSNQVCHYNTVICIKVSFCFLFHFVIYYFKQPFLSLIHSFTLIRLIALHGLLFRYLSSCNIFV